MPNPTVRAAAEGMPNVNRRGLLLGLAAASSAAAVSAAPHAHGSPSSTGLQDVIAACQMAENTYFECAAREVAIAETLGDKLYPKWTPPGAVTSIWAYRPASYRTAAALEIEIASKAEQVEAAFAAGLMNRAAYDRQKRDLATHGGEGLAWLRQQEAEVETSGYNEASRSADEAMERFGEAWRTLLRLPCHSIDDVRAKAAHLLHSDETMGWALEAEEVIVLLSSFSVASEA